MRALTNIGLAVVLLAGGAQAADASPHAAGQLTSSGAETRHAAPNGTASTLSDCTDPANPCSLQRAIDSAAAGDNVEIHPGDYPNLPLIQLTKQLRVYGTPGQPAPRLSFQNGGLEAFRAGTTLAHLDIVAATAGVYAQGGTAAAPVTADALVVHATGAGGTACSAASRTTFTNTICRSDGGEAFHLSALSQADVITLRNVTAIAQGNAITATTLQCPCNIDVQATNAIARSATAYDVEADGSRGNATVELSYSSYGTKHEITTSALVRDLGHNQSSPPTFVNAAAGDFHEAVGSPTVDAGLTDSSNGPTDFEGDPRVLGSATDIGADELVPQPPSAGSPSSVTAGPPAAGAAAAAADTVAPSFASASLTNRVFAVDRHGAGEQMVSARHARRGTAFAYTLSEPSRVVFTIERARARKCTRHGRGRRRRRACQLYRLVGRFAQAGAQGPNLKRWSGKIGKLKLAPGNYRATLAATDAAGNRSLPRQLSFRVVAG